MVAKMKLTGRGSGCTRFFAFFTTISMTLVSMASANCPFCPPSQPTYAEHLADCDVAVLCQWQSVAINEENETAKTTLKIREFLRQRGELLKVGDAVTLEFARTAQPGDLFVLVGKKSEAKGETRIEWQQILEATETSAQYMKQAPSPERPASERLPFFLRFLESSNAELATDAFAEFSKADYKDVAALKEKFPRDKIRAWLNSGEQAIAPRRGFYGLLLGFCGNEEDAQWLEDQILPPPVLDRPRQGLDGMMGGYVLLRGRTGLEKLRDVKLKDPEGAGSDAVAMINLLRFLWEYGEAVVPREEVKQTLRLALDRPELAELVLPDLARWKDWAIVSRLGDSFGKAPFDSRAAKSKLVEFMRVCAKDVPKEDAAPIPEHVTKAKEYLTRWEAAEPELFKPNPGVFFR